MKILNFFPRLRILSRVRFGNLAKMVDYAGKLRAEKVLIKNSESFNRKIAHILDGGTEKLQCVFDFDATISKAWHNGEKVKKKIIFGT